MDLFRVFPWDKLATSTSKGGPLFVPREMQGQGRHDIPQFDGVLYCSKDVVSAIAEFILPISSPFLEQGDFRLAEKRVAAIVHFVLDENAKLLNLDSGKILSQLEINPSQVITHRRDLTRKISERIYQEGYDGFLWPSSIEGLWTNATLFNERIRPHLSIGPQGTTKLSTKNSAVVEACRSLRIRIR